MNGESQNDKEGEGGRKNKRDGEIMQKVGRRKRWKKGSE